MRIKLKYKNYIGMAEWDDEAKAFHGSVIGMRDGITFVADKQEDLQNALAGSVEDYIEFCKETNKIPEKSCSGKFVLRIDPNVHAKIIAEAAYSGMSLNSYIENKLNSK